MKKNRKERPRSTGVRRWANLEIPCSHTSGATTTGLGQARGKGYSLVSMSDGDSSHAGPATTAELHPPVFYSIIITKK